MPEAAVNETRDFWTSEQQVGAAANALYWQAGVDAVSGAQEHALRNVAAVRAACQRPRFKSIDRRTPCDDAQLLPEFDIAGLDFSQWQRNPGRLREIVTMLGGKLLLRWPLTAKQLKPMLTGDLSLDLPGAAKRILTICADRQEDRPRNNGVREIAKESTQAKHLPEIRRKDHIPLNGTQPLEQNEIGRPVHGIKGTAKVDTASGLDAALLVVVALTSVQPPSVSPHEKGARAIPSWVNLDKDTDLTLPLAWDHPRTGNGGLDLDRYAVDDGVKGPDLRQLQSVQDAVLQLRSDSASLV